MGENGKIYNKLHVLLFFIKRDINIELVQDITYGITSSVNMLVLRML
jgi:hypothetical protein